MKKSILFGILCVFLAFQGFSQYNPPPTEDPNPLPENTEEIIVNPFQLIMSESPNEGTIRIFQDERIEQLFMDRMNPGAVTTMSGYRVQVFSSNIQSTAKNEAFRIEQLVRQSYPDENIYVSYTSPFWKVRVGDFRTNEDAKKFQTELMDAFPAIRKEMYVVRDEIIVSGGQK